MFGGEAGPGEVVDADHRDRVVGVAEGEGDEGQPALAGGGDQPVGVLDAEEHEPVDDGALDAPGERVLARRRDQRDADALRVAGLGDARHQGTRVGVLEEIGERLGGGDADGVDLAGAEQPPHRVGAGVADGLGLGEHAGADLGADEMRPVEDVRGRRLRDPGALRHVAEPRALAGESPHHAS